MRYRLHEMVRQYARDRLAEAREETPLRKRYLDYFTRLAEQAEVELHGPRQMEWLAQLDLERDNLTEALSKAVSAPDPLIALRLAGALTYYWQLRDRQLEGFQWLNTTLALPVAAEIQFNALPARAKCLFGKRSLGSFMLQYTQTEAERDAKECENIYLALGDRFGLLLLNCMLRKKPQDPQAWLAQLHESLAELDAAGNHRMATLILEQLWEWERDNGNFESGRVYGEDAVGMPVLRVTNCSWLS